MSKFLWQLSFLFLHERTTSGIQIVSGEIRGLQLTANDLACFQKGSRVKVNGTALNAVGALIQLLTERDGNSVFAVFSSLLLSPLWALERAWLVAQTDLARAPGWWRPVRWIELGVRMHDEWTRRERERQRELPQSGAKGTDANSNQDLGAQEFRCLYHGVLFEAWDRGEWRFAGHEQVFEGHAGYSTWAAWIQGREGGRWRGGGRDENCQIKS
ncbi:hypothetical protein C8R45DRAFT_937936 [Mycena sanguinolenta]|nr:hypothetical protein C8R45DRAFT_937936 [Mycena sanguinolenta]